MNRVTTDIIAFLGYAKIRRGRASVLAIVLLIPAAALAQQSSQSVNPCESADAKQFDFMLGDWRGIEKTLTDGKQTTNSTSEIQVKKVLSGCAIQENWEFTGVDGKKLFSAMLLRSFDTGSHRWMLSYVDDHLNHQLYEGRNEAGVWRFLRERLVEGKPVLVRITWTSESADRFIQTIERSENNGETWKPRAVITYSRKK